MPLYRFKCPCGWEDEELFRKHHDAEDSDVPEAFVCPDCGAKAPRALSNSFSHPKDISNMERYEEALLTPGQRAAGVRFRSTKEVELFEESQGMERIEPGTSAWDQAWESQADDASDLRSRGEAEAKAGGDAVSAAADHIEKTEIQQATGWDSTTYEKWKGRTDAAEHAAYDNPELAAG